MKFLEHWRRYWFRPAPYLDLAFVRIIAVGLQLFMVLRGSYEVLVYTNSLPTDMYSPVYILRLLLLDFDGVARPSPEFLFGIYWIALIAGAGSLAGFATNISLLIFATCNLLMQGYAYSFRDYHHPEAIMIIALFLLALSPSGRVLSLDAIIRKWRNGDTPLVPLLEYCGVYAGWAIRVLQWFFPLMYISAVVGKIGRSGIEWANGFTMQAIMIQSYHRHGSELALLLSSQHNLLLAAQYLVIAFQATFFLAVIYPRLRWIYLPAGLAFHLGIYFTMRATFPEWIVLYSVFIPWAAALASIANRKVPGEPGGLAISAAR